MVLHDRYYDLCVARVNQVIATINTHPSVTTRVRWKEYFLAEIQRVGALTLEKMAKETNNA